jgi:hypothetical protein
MSNLSYGDIPLAESPFGQTCYRAGRRVIEETGLRLAEIVFDADEILWDWVIDFEEILKKLPELIWHRDIGHTEYYLVKPGIFELIWGMRHASLEKGLDPYMRIWTDGYPWRLWKIEGHIPGFSELLGPPTEDGSPPSHEEFIKHPRIFFRTDYIETATQLLLKDNLSSFLKNLAPSVHNVVKDQLDNNPIDPSFKLPEFAAVRGKPGFKESSILIDDYRDNVYRFVASGRKGIYVHNETPTILGGLVPNTVWRTPKAALQEMGNYSVATEIAAKLTELSNSQAPSTRMAYPNRISDDYDPILFTIDIPDRMLRSEWLEPVRNLKKQLQV